MIIFVFILYHMSKTLWGNATWYLFHTLSYRLKEEHGHKANELFDVFTLIASTLPCPNCSEHARQTLRAVNKRALNTKEALVSIMWEFHNRVNARLGKPAFSRQEHDELYRRADPVKIVSHFRDVYRMKHGDERAMIHGWSRKIAVEKLDDFLKSNSAIFH